jgi:hypothetical protein
MDPPTIEGARIIGGGRGIPSNPYEEREKRET